MSLRDSDLGRRSRVLRGRGWSSHLPLAFVVVALVALVTLPLAAERYARPLNQELRVVIEPARELVTRIHVELAIQGSTFHDYFDAADSALLQRYRESQQRELQTQGQLAAYVAQLGDTVRIPFERMQTLGREWHELVDTLIETRLGGNRARSAAMREEDLFEELLVATADLDDALARAARDRRAKVIDAERMQRRFTMVVGVVALGAVGTVAWLAQRVRVYAREAEERRIELERATESRARLMRGVSHDLKNPLGAIDGHAAVLEDGVKGPLNDGQRESIARIRRSVRALLGLISDLLELSKAESGHLSIRPRPTNVADVVRETAEEHRDAAAAAGHELRTEIRDSLPTIQTDPDRVRQVLGNLLSNAVKYTPSGGQIVVRVEERSGNEAVERARCTAIDVIDSGPGIPQDKLEQIFEEFFRLETARAQGTGLGLTVARRISRLLGGDVSVTSEVGRGATFTLWLPLEPPRTERRPVQRRREHV